MSNLTELIKLAQQSLSKQANVPIQEVQGMAQQIPGQAPPAGAAPPPPGAAPPGAAPPGAAPSVDPATGMPIDPATGMPIDPATGMPMDPTAGMPQVGSEGDPVVQIMDMLKAIVKTTEQTRMLVATMIDAYGIRVPTDKVLSAGEDAVKEHAEKAEVPAAKEAGLYLSEDVSDGTAGISKDTEALMNLYASESDGEPEDPPPVDENGHVDNRSDLIKRWANG